MPHENLVREEHIDGSSNRSFGMVFFVVFVVIACIPVLNGEAIRWWAMGTAAIFAVVAMVKPALLAELNRLWTKFGLLLGKIVSPIALGVMFYLVITPIGLVIRLTGNDPLRLKLDPDAKSYWIPREPPGPTSDSMKNQF